ncbi:hypothetical protein N7G274_004197 [Stereocaulon virgatum]|uniref:Uncharacterized protein n=1 Tax=Stereocaulon virgatum TaxID=373712 RepID=A0ABR4AB87_9LECA
MRARDVAAAYVAIQVDNMLYSYYMFIMLSGIVASFLVHRAAIDTSRYNRPLTCLNDDWQRFFRSPHRIYAFPKQHLICAPLFNVRYSNKIRLGRLLLGRLPTRFQSLLLAAIITVNTFLRA